MEPSVRSVDALKVWNWPRVLLRWSLWEIPGSISLFPKGALVPSLPAKAVFGGYPSPLLICWAVWSGIASSASESWKPELGSEPISTSPAAYIILLSPEAIVLSSFLRLAREYFDETDTLSSGTPVLFGVSFPGEPPIPPA